MFLKTGTYVLRFLLIMFFQVFILNDIYLFGIMHPYLYILFLFTLPIHINKGFYLILAFLTGFVIDVFTHTYGIHASAALVFAFFRNFMISAFKNLDDFSELTEPHIHSLGVRDYFIVIFVLTLLHHFTLYIIEVATFGNILHTIFHAVINTIITLLLLVIIELVIFFKAHQVNEPVRK